jgi:hypothetical protein
MLGNQRDFLIHHPFLMEGGDLRGRSERGYIPIKKEWLIEKFSLESSYHTNVK